MDWKQLLCEERECASAKKAFDERNEFQRDYHRIIGSASFRRLQDKTQVFPLDNSDFVRTRLTHSLEVSSFAKSLAQSSFMWLRSNKSDCKNIPDSEQIVKISSILECAGLIHDIGNPPFGHFGEYSIRNWFIEHFDTLELKKIKIKFLLNEQMINDLINFEGNAQALRLLTRLHYLVDDKGMHLTYALLNTIIKYPVNSLSINKRSGNIKDKKLGYYYAETELFNDITTKTGAGENRYPLVYLLEAADDIAYSTADIEDAVKKGYISYEQLLDEFDRDEYKKSISSDNELKTYQDAVGRLKNNYEKARRQGLANAKINAVQNWIIYVQGILLRAAQFGFTKNYDLIMNGVFDKEILSSDYSTGKTLLTVLKNTAVKYVFNSYHITKMELSAATIINFFLDHFIPAAIKYDSGEKLNAIEERYIRIISDNYKKAYKTASQNKDENEKLYLRLLLITDYICGMTDSYAKSLYQELNGM